MDQAAKAAIDDYYDGDSLRYDEIGRIYRAMLSAVPPVQPEEGWRPIETAPRDGTEIDLWGYWPENDRWKRTADAWWDSAENCWRLDQYRHEGMYVHRPRFTHWQPLPVPPVLADGGGSSYASPSQPDAARHGSQADAEPSGKED
jgi:hypothetical protein